MKFDKNRPELMMECALDAASPYLGSPSPNPCVGAAAFDKDGCLIHAAAHTIYGQAHGEAKLLEHCRKHDLIDKIYTLAITLEPCAHHGKTPSCAQAILCTSIPNILIGIPDPNPIAKGGADFLKKNGRNIIDNIGTARASHQMLDFIVKQREKRPLVIIKIAINEDGNMIPPTGQKTFSSEESLILSHRLRKRVDSIITGSGTIISDNPSFTVRHVNDFEHKQRRLVIMDRRQRLQDTELTHYSAQHNFIVARENDIQSALCKLGENGCNSVLIEAGPTLSSTIFVENLWDIAVFFKNETGSKTRILAGRNPQKPLLKGLDPFNLNDFLASEPNVTHVRAENINDPADTLRHISTLCV